MKNYLDKAVVFMVFNRPSTTRRVFEAIARARPARLLVIADGPRSDRPGEAKLCEEVRAVVSAVNWPCEVSTNFSPFNLGCCERVVSGLNWAFSLVEEAIILEDDCLPDPSFFPFCEELLDKYRGDGRISYISGTNLVQQYTKTNDSYYFSRIGGIWGWATWRSEWLRYDRYLKDWPTLRSENKLAEVFDQPEAVEYWTKVFDSMYRDKTPGTWDYQWLYTVLKNNSITIVPRINLVANIGFGQGATHTVHEDPRFMLSASSIEFPLKHPISLIPSRSLDSYRMQDMFPPPILRRIITKLRRSVGIRP